LIEYVADRDLWKKELPYTEELSFALWFDGYFNDFNKLANLIEKVPTLTNLESQPIIKKGQLLVTSKNQDIKSYTYLAVPAKLNLPSKTLNVRIVCCPRQYRSDVGNEINQIFPEIDCAATYWYDHQTDQWWVSLRARQDSNINLADLTNDLETGGGHPKAAGFTIKKGSLDAYFKLENITCASPNLIQLPILKDYRDKEISGYLNAVKDNKFHLNEIEYPVKMTCVPIHYQRLVLDEMKKKFKDLTNSVYWYDFARNLWSIMIDTSNHNLINLVVLDPVKALGSMPILLTDNILFWSFIEDFDDGKYKFTKFFYK
jgi:hypothetical protein